MYPFADQSVSKTVLSGHAMAQLVEATSRNVEGSFPDTVTGIFYWCSPSSRSLLFITCAAYFGLQRDTEDVDELFIAFK